MKPQLILLFFQVISTFGYEFNDKNPDNNLGTMYIRNIGGAKVFCRYRVIEYNLKLQNFMETKQELLTTTQLLHDLCSENFQNRTCQLTTDELNYLMVSLENKYSILESTNILAKNNIRQKRETDNIPELIQQSVTLSDYSYSDLKQKFEQMNSLTKRVEKYHNDTSITIGQVNFNSLAYLTFQIIKRQLKLYDNILEIIINKNPKLIAEMISIEGLREDLNQTSKLVNKEFCEFPIELNIINIINLFKKSKIYTETSTESFIIGIKLPTTYKSNFKLLSVTPIPFIYNNASFITIPTSPYYLITTDSRNNDHYSIPLSIEERLNCTDIPKNLLCFPRGNFEVLTNPKLKLPEYLLNPTYEICDTKNVNHLKNLKAIPTECNIRRIPHINRIIQLGENTLYLHLTRPTTVKFSCFGSNLSYNMSKSVLITEVNKDCSVYFDDGYHAEQRDVFIKAANIFSTSFTTYSIFKNDLIENPTIKNDTYNFIRDLQPEYGDLLEKLKNMATTPPKKNSNMINKQIQIFLITIIILLTLTWSFMTYLYCQFVQKYSIIKTTKVTTDISGSNISMATIPPNLDCKFNFELSPLLPPKTRSLPRSPEPYDFPKYTTKSQTQEFELLPTNSSTISLLSKKSETQNNRITKSYIDLSVITATSDETPVLYASIIKKNTPSTMSSIGEQPLITYTTINEKISPGTLV